MRRRNGFTLVEVIVAMGILIVMVLAATQFALQATSSMISTTRRTQAESLASARLSSMQLTIEGQRTDGVISDGSLTAVKGSSSQLGALSACYSGGTCSDSSASSVLVNAVSQSTILTGGDSGSASKPPVTTVTYSNGMAYRVTELVGECHLMTIGSSSASSSSLSCTKTGTDTEGNSQSESMMAVTKQIRPIVIVSWDDGSCHYDSSCTISRSSLIAASTKS